MPRVARERSESGIYHVMVRGINKQDIFLDDEDNLRYLQTIARVKERIRFSVYGYCLMRNHVHLLLREENEISISQVMQRIGVSYVQWYNTKYERVGHLFQDRFLSVPIETDNQFLAVLRYIHRNPVEAGISRTCADYPWSSYAAYSSGVERFSNLTDTSFTFEVGGGRQQLMRFLDAPPDATDFEVATEPFPATDTQILQVIHALLAGNPIASLKNLPREDRDRILWKLKLLPGASVTQIARLTGLSKATVSRVKNGP